MTTQDTSYRTIPLTQNQIAIVDASEYERVSRWNWYAAWDKETQSFYAVRNSEITSSNGHQRPIKMHRFIMGLEFGDKRHVDHRDHNTLDNRRRNLRVCVPHENSSNRRMHSNNTSGYKGVSFHKGTRKWQAQIIVKRKHLSLGYFNTPQEAHAAYCEASKKYHREFGRTE
jgi:AP2 domain-containing protein/HNH endonuclease